MMILWEELSKGVFLSLYPSKYLVEIVEKIEQLADICHGFTTLRLQYSKGKSESIFIIESNYQSNDFHTRKCMQTEGVFGLCGSYSSPVLASFGGSDTYSNVWTQLKCYLCTNPIGSIMSCRWSCSRHNDWLCRTIQSVCSSHVIFVPCIYSVSGITYSLLHMTYDWFHNLTRLDVLCALGMDNLSGTSWPNCTNGKFQRSCKCFYKYIDRLLGKSNASNTSIDFPF